MIDAPEAGARPNDQPYLRTLLPFAAGAIAMALASHARTPPNLRSSYTSVMRIMRRATAVFAEILMIQFAVISGSFGCPLARSAFADATSAAQFQSAANVSGHEGTSDSHHHGQPASSQGGHDGKHSSPASSGHRDGPHHSHSHCDSPCVPAGCMGVVHCSSVAASPNRATLNSELTDRDGARPETVQIPLSVATAPDTPPPRA